MKKFVPLLLALILFVSWALPAAATGKADLPLFINGQRIIAESRPVVDKMGVYVPYKSVFGALGYTASYSAKGKMYMLKSAGVTIKFTVGSKFVFVNEKKKKLTLSPKMIGGTVYVPLSFITDTIKIAAVYDKLNQVIQIGKPAVVDRYFQVSFGMTYNQVKKMEKGKLLEGSQDKNGDAYLMYDDVTLSNGIKGGMNYIFKRGTLSEVDFLFDHHPDDYDAALSAYKKDKVYLEKIYNKGAVTPDFLWNSDEDVQAQYATKYANRPYDLQKTAITTGDLDLNVTYTTASFSVTASLMNLNADEVDDPYYTETIMYVKK
ncbi:hypothetical protein J2Z69_001883 [Paenibacillus shirakamiensis]|uniref:Copper amine oxidase-like N-terminal domain-containing protein n=1 Tax=Paenibacillus shirakamiensis TaxID=1265935 RepID=A0ABS4JGL7_9BACL|nr:copper amine oxidase N-terminal domain-containing protein [Paenibacillus shirakamiensis]MBP2000852.1 hypothetical protein [Paenibacillus shirakamiensis]